VPAHTFVFSPHQPAHLLSHKLKTNMILSGSKLEAKAKAKGRLRRMGKRKRRRTRRRKKKKTCCRERHLLLLLYYYYYYY
jgi:hypothetical protein